MGGRRRARTGVSVVRGKHRDLALAFLDRFAAGDVEGLAPLLSDDLRVTGPYVDVATRADYLAALRAAPPRPATIRPLSVTEGESTVAVFYRYEKPGRTRTVAQLFRCRGDQICEMLLVFDLAALG